MLSGSNFAKSPLGRSLVLGLLVFGLTAALTFSTFGQFLEDRALDYCYQWRSLAPPPPDILLVGIDEVSFQEFRRPWPWPRRLHAALVDRLVAAGASLIAFDVIFAEPTTPEDDRLLQQAIQRAGNVILAQTYDITKDHSFSRQILIQPLAPFLHSAAGVGLSMVTPDNDGVVRRFQLRLQGQETLGALAARIIRPQMQFPEYSHGLIDFAGPPRSLETVSYYQILDPDHPYPDKKINGKIVLVGRMLEASATPQSQADAFYAPYFSLTGQLMSGVEIHGNILHTLLSGRSGGEPAWSIRLLLTLLAAFFSAYVFAKISPLLGLGVLGALAGLILGISSYLFLVRQFWLPPILLTCSLVLTYAGNGFIHYLVVTREKRWLRQAFSRYVSASLVETITSHPERLSLGGEEVEITLLFSDVAGFTSISENMTPQELIHLLNEYFSTMTDIIQSHQGTVDKFIGDAIMAFWGAPVALADHAGLACEAALAMQEALKVLQRSWQARGLPQLHARLGLHTGLVIAGNVGSKERFNYTVMGDAVNLASRLEGVNKIYGTEILISEDTYEHLPTTIFSRELDIVQVKGRLQPVKIYELIANHRDGDVKSWQDSFQAGRFAYATGQWELAISNFKETLALRPGDRPAELFLDRCRHYRRHPPPPGWEGVFVLESK